ncbi:hypothetical protein MKX01_000384 [Papaver californicum]|nr:hypothetical protein MKX01_000384 [Papaver californicum]
MQPSTLNKTSVSDKSLAHTMDRNVSLAVGKRPTSDVQKTPSMSGLQIPLLKPQPSSSSMQRAPSKSKQMPKQPVPCPTAPKVKTPKQLPSHPPAPKDRRRKRSRSPDPADYRQMIRNMFGYNPGKYGDDKDDSSMEVGFKDIMREERRSSRIANEEDEREHILLEEIKTSMRKKRKLSSQQ